MVDDEITKHSWKEESEVLWFREIKELKLDLKWISAQLLNQ